MKWKYDRPTGFPFRWTSRDDTRILPRESPQKMREPSLNEGAVPYFVRFFFMYSLQTAQANQKRLS